MKKLASYISGIFSAFLDKCRNFLFSNYKANQKNSSKRSKSKRHTLPAIESLYNFLVKIIRIQIKLNENDSLRTLVLKIEKVTQDFLIFLGQAYHYPVKDKPGNILEFYFRNSLDTLLQETKDNRKIKGRDHSQRVIEAYRNLLQCIDDARKILIVVDNYFNNSHMSKKINLKQKECLEELQEKLNILLNYLNDHLGVFQEIIKKIKYIHLKHKVKNFFYTTPKFILKKPINHNPLIEELQKFFFDIKKSEEKHIGVKTISQEKEQLHCLKSTVTTESIQHNKTPDVSPDKKSKYTPNTEKSASYLNQATEAYTRFRLLRAQDSKEQADNLKARLKDLEPKGESCSSASRELFPGAPA